jgi:hypothetical protein
MRTGRECGWVCWGNPGFEMTSASMVGCCSLAIMLTWLAAHNGCTHRIEAKYSGSSLVCGRNIEKEAAPLVRCCKHTVAMQR